jgi:hypothetical protein
VVVKNLHQCAVEKIETECVGIPNTVPNTVVYQLKAKKGPMHTLA